MVERTRVGVLVSALCGCLASFACAGHWVDERCIKGRLSEEQAKEINEGPWGHLPTYNRDAEGKCLHCAEAQDRVLAAACSDFLKRITEP